MLMLQLISKSYDIQLFKKIEGNKIGVGFFLSQNLLILCLSLMGKGKTIPYSLLQYIVYLSFQITLTMVSNKIT